MLEPSKKQLSITLTEPVLFLRSSDPSGRLHSDPNVDPPTLVRGILALNVVKPIAISSIEVELTGILAVSYSEGIGPRRIEVSEKQKIYSSTVTVFRADQVPRGRLSTSVGPGLSAASSSEDRHGASPRQPSLPRGRPERRCDVVSVPQLGPTPPYTSVVRCPIQSKLGASVEHPAQTLEELRQALRDNLEGQSSFNGFVPQPSHSHSTAFSLPNPVVHSSASSTSNGSLHRENDNRTDDVVHSSPPLEGDLSFRNAAEEFSQVPPYCGPPPRRLSQSPETSHESQPHARGNSRDASNNPASRSRLRLTLAPVLDAVREVTSRASSRSRSVARTEERGRGRTRARIVTEDQSREDILELAEGTAGQSSLAGTSGPHPNGYAEHREHHLLGLGRVLGLERDQEKEIDGEQKSKEHSGTWKEFKPGTYSYPISFLLPSDLPPTFSVPNGLLNYTIKAVAHRPGTFTSKLSCQVLLLVVAAPAIGTGEGGEAGDPGPLFVQKQWEGKLAYSFGLNSRLFLLGSRRHLEVATRANSESHVEVGVEARAEASYGTVTLDLTLLPLEKIKIWRLTIFVDQHIKCLDERGRPTKDDEKRQVKLLELHDTCPEEEMGLREEEDQTQKNKQKQKQKHDLAQIPLLPTPISPHRSPLLRYLSPSTDPSILAGPGPYALSAHIGLPGCDDTSVGDAGLHFTMKQRASNVKVEHSLRLVMRVESVGDVGADGHDMETRKLFDIAVQTPITILSCRCVPEYQTLPRYSQITEDNFQNLAACPCQPNVSGSTERGRGHEVGHHLGHVVSPSSSSSFESENWAIDDQRSDHERLRSPSRPRRGSRPSPLAVSLRHRPPSPVGHTRETSWNRSPSQARSFSRSQHNPYSVPTTHARAPSQTPPSRPPSPLARYERLVSGLESEAGEAPPSYESITSGP